MCFEIKNSGRGGVLVMCGFVLLAETLSCCLGYDRMQFYAEINQASRTVVVVVLHHTLSFVIF